MNYEGLVPNVLVTKGLQLVDEENQSINYFLVFDAALEFIWPISYRGQMSQSLCHKANIGTRCKTRENTCEQIAIGFANESLVRNPDQITKHSEAKTNQFRNHFKQAQFKTALLLIHVFFHGRWFHGCVALVRYSSAGGRLLANANLVKSHGVQGNCSGEECSGNLFKCQNGGRCVDLVINTECNCYRTGYYGQYCEQSGRSSIRIACHPLNATRLKRLKMPLSFSLSFL